MALTVKTKGFPTMIREAERRVQRARKLPRSARLRTTRKLAVIHHFGGRQVVTRRVQRGLGRRIGKTAKPPAVGKVLVHPRRAVRVDKQMATEMAADYAKNVIRGGRRRPVKIMRGGVMRQFAAGGPFWKKSRDYGDFKSRSPTLGGARGRVDRGWNPGAKFSER